MIKFDDIKKIEADLKKNNHKLDTLEYLVAKKDKQIERERNEYILKKAQLGNYEDAKASVIKNNIALGLLYSSITVLAVVMPTSLIYNLLAVATFSSISYASHRFFSRDNYRILKKTDVKSIKKIIKNFEDEEFSLVEEYADLKVEYEEQKAIVSDLNFRIIEAKKIYELEQAEINVDTIKQDIVYEEAITKEKTMTLTKK